MSKYIDELNEKYNNGEISLNEKSKLYDEYINSDDYNADVEYESKKSAEKTKTTIESKSSNENKITLRRKEFNEKYSGYTENEIQMELLYAQQVNGRKLEKIRTDTSKLVWFLIAIPIILGVLAGIFLS